MQTAPVGLGAYFAYQVFFGPTVWSLCQTIRTLLCCLCFYFIVLFFSLYAYWLVEN
jgi:hypothetical protein